MNQKNKKRKKHSKKTKDHRKQKGEKHKIIKREPPNIFSDVAMENCYYTCHNVGDFLTLRGYLWENTPKKKKKETKAKKSNSGKN